MTAQERAFARSVQDLHENYRTSLSTLQAEAWDSGDAALIARFDELADAVATLSDDVDPIIRKWVSAGGNAGLRDSGIELFAWVQRTEVQEAISQAAFQVCGAVWRARLSRQMRRRDLVRNC